MLQVATRLFLVVFGERYWMIGHALMYTLLALFFGRNALSAYFPLVGMQTHSLTVRGQGTARKNDASNQKRLRLGSSGVNLHSTEGDTQVSSNSEEDGARDTGRNRAGDDNLAITPTGRVQTNSGTSLLAVWILTIIFIAEIVLSAKLVSIPAFISKIMKIFATLS